jgi:integrase
MAAWLGGHRPLTDVRDDEIVTALRSLWGDAAAATWNRNRAAVSGWLAWCRSVGQAAPAAPAVERRPETAAPTAVLQREAIERLLISPDVPLRERTLWRMLYETTGRVHEVLALDVPDLHLRSRRARLKDGGDLYWGVGTAHLLPRLIRGRARGPVFLSERRPPPARRPQAEDLCPITGRARLGYDRARILLDQHTRPAVDAPGWDLHQLRLSALAHQAESEAEPHHLAARARSRTVLRYFPGRIRPDA